MESEQSDWLDELRGDTFGSPEPEPEPVATPDQELEMEAQAEEPAKKRGLGRLFGRQRGESEEEGEAESLVVVDDLRDQMIESGAMDYDEPEQVRLSRGGVIPGMTPAQGAVISIFLLLNICILAAVALLVTGKIQLPF